MNELHPDREVLVTPLDPRKDDLAGTYPMINFPGVGRLLMSPEDFAKLQLLLGSADLIGRTVELSPAEDGVRICVRMVAS